MMKLRKLIALFSALLMLCSVLPLGTLPATAEVVEAFTNGDLETGDTTGFASVSGTSLTTEKTHGGSYALKATKTTINYSTLVKSQPIDVMPNTQYVASAWYYYDGTNAGPGFYLYIKNKGNSVNISSTAETAVKGQWHQVTLTFNSGDNEQLLFLLQNKTVNDGGTYYFDDLSLCYVISEPVDPNNAEMMYNGDLELGNHGGFAAVNGTTVTSERAHSGKYSFKAINTVSLYATLVKSNMVPVVPNTEYTASLWYYYQGTTESPAYYLFIKDMGNSVNVTSAEINPVVKGEWTEVSVTFNSGDNSSVLFLLQNKAVNDGGIYFFDDLSVKGPDPEYVDQDTPGDDPEAPANCLKNGSFESGNAANWNIYQDTKISAAAKYRGEYGMMLTGSGTSDKLAGQDVAVEAGQTYVVSAWMMTVATGANIQIKDGSSTGALLASDWFDKTQWTRVSYTVIPTTDTLHVSFVSSDKNVSERVYLDSVAVVKLDNDGFILNGNFEVGETDPWVIHQDTALSTEADQSGLYGLHLKGDGGWGALAYQDFTTEVGKTYNLSIYLRTIQNGCNVQLVNVADGTVLATKWFNTAGWNSVSMEFKATGTTTRINLCGSGNGEAESVHMDNAYIFEVKESSFDGYMYNGDFEMGNLSDWTRYYDTQVSPEAAHSGHFGCKAIGNGSWGATLYQDVYLEPSKTYKISFWYKMISSGMNFEVTGRKTEDQLHYKHFSGASDWTYYEFTIQSQYNTSTRIKFFGSNKGVPEEMWVDDFKVECLSGDEMDRRENLEALGISIRDTQDSKRGLAFRFKLDAAGTQVRNEYELVPNSGSLQLYQFDAARGNLLETGAVVSNLENATELTLNDVNGKDTIKIPAKYLLSQNSESIEYAVRIINIPDKASGSEIYVRPYYTYMADGEVVTIYGNTLHDNYDAVTALRPTKRILTIGGEDSYHEIKDHLSALLKSSGYDQVILGNLALDSGHSEALTNFSEVFTYRKDNDKGVWTTTQNVAGMTALREVRWDTVVVDLPEATDDEVAAVVNWVRSNQLNGDTKILVRNHAKVDQADGVLAIDIAIKNLATVLKDDALTDEHCTFTATLTWYLATTGKSLDEAPYYPASLASALFNMGRAAAHAVATPDKVTDLSETLLLAGSDYQPAVWESGPPIVEGLLAGAMKNGTTLFDGFFAGGDYASQTGHDVSTQGIGYLDDIISNVAYGNKIYVEGNHDAPTVEMINPYGANDPVGAPYGAFVVNEEVYGAYGSGGEQVAKDLTAYFNEKIGNKSWGNKPIFVLSHVPLHYSRRTVDESCGKSAAPVIKALNAAGEAGLNVIFLFAHNHSSAYDDYLGGASIYLKKGDQMLVCSTQTDGQKYAPTTETIKFTYMNYGYINNYANHGSGADIELTMTTFRIRPDGAVIVTRYDKNGVHNLKSAGKRNVLDNDYIVVNPTVYESSRIVTATDDQPYTE